MSGSGGPLPTDGGFAGQAWAQSAGTQFQAIDFMIRQVIAGKSFLALVLVKAVHGGGVGSPASVDVQPMVNQQDVLGTQTPHGIVYGMACWRYQGGASAAIIDPVAGDIGLAAICDRDISGIKLTGSPGPAGSHRQNAWSDGIYFGSVIGATPANYIQIAASGINITSTGTIAIMAAGGTSIDGREFLTHKHSGVQTGGGDTGSVV